MATSRIRSGYQRRILDELLDGPATVTALAARLSLATSHTSSTLRTLRQQGLVTRDEREGVRGAPHHLSPQGLIRLQEDALERLRELLLASLKKPKKRVATRPSKAAKRKRLEDKGRRSKLKQSRGRISSDKD